MHIGLIGTGLMGYPMAQRLLAAGYPLTVYNRTASKAEPLQQEGATVATHVPDVVAAAECLVLMLADAPAIDQAFLTSEVLPLLAGRTVLQMGTIAPAESQSVAEQVTAAGGAYLEAPVLGSIPQAASGELIVMVGGTPEQYQAWRGVLATFGHDPLHVGPVGSAAALKLAMNQLIGSLTGAFALSLGLVLRHGINVDTFMHVLRNSALYAPTFDKKLPRMQDRDFDNPNFPVRHMLKDMELVEREAAACNLHTAEVAGVCSILKAAIDAGFADSDYSALFAAVVPGEE